MEEPPLVSLLHMPHEVCAGIVWSLGVKDTSKLASSCKLFGQETADAELWFQLFLRTCWPPSGALLAFAEGTTTPVGIDWRQRMQVRMESSPTIVAEVVDIGRGYTKFTVAHGLRGRWELDGSPPELVQLCSSPTHPPDCDRNEQLRYIHHRLDRTFMEAATDPNHRLHKTALSPAQLKVDHYAVYKNGNALALVRLEKHCPTENLWTVVSVKNREPFQVAANDLTLMRRAHDLPILIGEPFVITANRTSEQTAWDCNIRSQLGNDRPGAVQVVSQAQMALWAHGLDHGIVVNIGQAQTIALPVVRGEVVASCCTTCDVGSADLTQVMVSLMHRKTPSLDGSLMTWCRDLKEAYCYVSPPGAGSLRARLAAGDDFGIRPVPVELPQYAREQSTLELAEERVLVPEVLFETRGRGQSLPQIIVQCAKLVHSKGTYTQEDIRDLLRQVVLVGGAADFPGIRPRVEYEMRCLLQRTENHELSSCCESTDDVYVLNPPLDRSSNPLVSPRFVPLFGGCVRAASSMGYGALERDKNTGALRSLPLQDTEQGEGDGRELRRTLMWQRRLSGMLALQLPNIFRTGGGGGEDDQVWQEFFDEDEDMELPDESPSLPFSEDSPAPSPDEASSSSPSPTRSGRCDTKGAGKGKGKRKGSGASSGRGRPRRVWRPVTGDNSEE